jgi:hypothetical protein
VSDSTVNDAGKAGQLRDKITTSQSRNRSRAPRKAGAVPASSDEWTPPDTRSVVERTIDDHPLALLAGSLIMGVVAANLLQASLGRRIAGRLLGVIAVAGEYGAKAGSKTLGAAAEAGRSGQERLSRLGDLVAEEGAEVRRRALDLGTQAGRRALTLAEEAAREAREKGSHALGRIGKLGGEAASEVREKGTGALDRLSKLRSKG